ncbi:MAG: PQQ-binding-like beta-propeller repeat protein [Phycisphaerae bacterium]|nr:PQQ-binding-like beta-propeller repeat protein [Phycisphaerae bacterium]
MSIRRSMMIVAGALLLAPVAQASAENWANWRGPHYNGSSGETNLPRTFSKTDNVKWVANLPGPGAGTPIIVNDQVLVTSTESRTRSLVAMCLDRGTGTVRWQKVLRSGKINHDNRSNYASPSPVTDGKLAVFLYGDGTLAALDIRDGRKLWAMDLQKKFGQFSYQWTYSASPTLHNGVLYVQVLQRDEPVHGRGKDGNESYLLALDPAKGRLLWRHVRPSSAKKESLESFATPIPFRNNGREELIIAGGDCLTGHDPATGRELWRWGTYNPGHREAWWRLVPSPVVGDGVVMACAPKKAPIYAVRTGGTGDISAKGLLWKSEDQALTSDVPTPLFYEGRFFVLSDLRKSMSCVEPRTGKIVWQVKMPGRELFRASPIGADGRIFCMNHGAQVTIFDAATGKLIESIDMGDAGDQQIRSSIAISQGNLFIRTNGKLYCIGS